MGVKGFLFGVFVIAALAGCSNEVHFKISPNGEVVPPIEFGSGVFYFNLSGATYGSSLSAFRAKMESDWEFIGTDAEIGEDGKTVGHWVYFQKKIAKKQEDKAPLSARDGGFLFSRSAGLTPS